MGNDSKKVFTIIAIAIASFFGGPLATGLLISHNYKVFGRKNAARIALFLAIVLTFILVVVILTLVEIFSPQVIFRTLPLIFSLIAAQLTYTLQGNSIKEFIANSGQKASNWHATALALPGFVIIIACIGVSLWLGQNNLYDKEIRITNNASLYYSSKIDSNKVTQLIACIDSLDLWEESTRSDLLLSENADFYKLIFLINDTILSDEDLIFGFNFFEDLLNSHLNFPKKIEIFFVESDINDDVELVEMEIHNPDIYKPLLYFSNYDINDKQKIFFNYSTPKEYVNLVEEAIIQSANISPYKSLTVILIVKEEVLVMKYFVEKVHTFEINEREIFIKIVDYLQQNGIDEEIQLIAVDAKTFMEALDYTSNNDSALP